MDGRWEVEGRGDGRREGDRAHAEKERGRREGDRMHGGKEEDTCRDGERKEKTECHERALRCLDVTSTHVLSTVTFRPT